MTLTDHSKAQLENEGVVVSGAQAGESRATRKASHDVAAHPVPTGREEEWRFAPMRDLLPLFQAEETTVSADVVSYEIDEVDGVEIGQLGAGESPRGEVLIPEDLVAARAADLTANALHLRARRGTEVSAPTVVAVTGHSAETVAHAAFVLETQESSSATFVLNHTGTARYAQNVEMVLGDNSQMTVISLQDWDDDAVHVATHVARIGRDATLKHIVVSLGGKAVRVNATTRLQATGGEVEQTGLYFSDAKQHLEHRLFVDHSAPRCTSNVTYKGALQGKGARSVWVGDVLIRKEAEGTQTYEVNRNLVLTEGARADSVPNLEIETGEIEGAGHAAATGRFDDEQLFYLQARGITELEARRLVVRGFFAELIQKIDVPEIREHLTASIEAELTRSMN